MKPVSGGRHCTSCAKMVVDFSDWQQKDILNFLKQHSGKKVCGRFRKTQLSLPVIPHEHIVQEVWKSSLNFLQKIAAIIVLFFAMSIASCQSNVPVKHAETVQDSVLHDNATVRTLQLNDEIEMGEVSEMPPDTIYSSKKKANQECTKEIAPNDPETYILGAPLSVPIVDSQSRK